MSIRMRSVSPSAPDEVRAAAARPPRVAARGAAPAVDRTLLILALLLAACLLVAGCAAPPEAGAPAAVDAQTVDAPGGATGDGGATDAGNTGDAGDALDTAPAPANSPAEVGTDAGDAADAGGGLGAGAAPGSAAATSSDDPSSAVGAPPSTDAPSGTLAAEPAAPPVGVVPADSAAAPVAAAPPGVADAQPAAGVGDTAPASPASSDDPRTHVLSIERLRTLSYPGSDLVVEETLPAGSNYSRSVVSYESEGNTIYALFTVPSGEKPAMGWPVVIFNHGYIPPAQYRTTERYVAYQDAFARAGYITLKSDYRGHGRSEGEATGGRGTPDYTIDVLNGMASVARHPDADPNRIGMWGHSMGGSITLRSMVISRQIKAGVIWAGVVASYPDMYNRLGQGPAPTNAGTPPTGRRGWRLDLVERFGTPDENPAAWAAVSPNAFLADISGPLQLHHGTADHSVPVEYSQVLQQQMEAAGRPSETFIYDGDDHNLSQSLGLALERSVAFFDQHVKGGG